MKTALALLQPTFWTLIALALVVGSNRLLFPPAATASTELVAPSALAANDLPNLGADQVVLPSPELSPAEVVRTQLAGLAERDAKGVGILQCFCFASPANRAVTGPLDRFGTMVRQGEFACLGDPQATLVGTPRISGPLARLLVTVVDRDRQLRAFTFILSRQTGEPFKDCWMTEAVYPVGSPLAEPPPPPNPENEPSADEI